MRDEDVVYGDTVESVPVDGPRRRRPRTLIAVGCSLAAAIILSVLAVGAIGGTAETENTAGTSSSWPRPYDPAKPFNFEGVPGVSAAQRDRATALLIRSLEVSEQWKDVQTALDAGWFSLGDEDIGYLHLINPDKVYDGKMLDPLHPESLVYKVEGEKRIFAAYMFIADPTMQRNDPYLTDFAGQLIEWHNHENLCLLPVPWSPIGRAAGIVNSEGGCDFPGASPALPRHPLDPSAKSGSAPKSSVASYPMTHVWVIAHECGPFSAVEGPAEGVTLDARIDRTDVCHH
jgi:hypothetical protein